MINTHLSTFQPRKWDFAKHAQPQPKKVRAYIKKKCNAFATIVLPKITREKNNSFKFQTNRHRQTYDWTYKQTDKQTNQQLLKIVGLNWPPDTIQTDRWKGEPVYQQLDRRTDKQTANNCDGEPIVDLVASHPFCRVVPDIFFSLLFFGNQRFNREEKGVDLTDICGRQVRTLDWNWFLGNGRQTGSHRDIWTINREKHS